MATDRPSPPEGFERFEPSGGDDDGERIELEPGDVLHGMVLNVREDENENGPYWDLRVKDRSRGVVDYFAKGEVKAACREGTVEEGVELWAFKDPEKEESFTRSDGEEVTYYKTVCHTGGA